MVQKELVSHQHKTRKTNTIGGWGRTIRKQDDDTIHEAGSEKTTITKEWTILRLGVGFTSNEREPRNGSGSSTKMRKLPITKD